MHRQKKLFFIKSKLKKNYEYLQRYRLQSENLPALWIISQHILHRLKQRYHQGCNGKKVIL